MRNWKRSLLLGLVVLAAHVAPVSGAEAVDCKRACREAVQACLQVCSATPAGRARGACKTACRRARRPCVQICQTQLPN